MNMLSSIRTAWPPAPSPEQPQTGWKMLTHSGSSQWKETLVGLHVPAWWTGLRLTAAEGWDTTYRVRLRRFHDLPAFPDAGADFSCEWVQKSGDWHPFPWALPASMATTGGFFLEITPTENVPNNLITSVRICFHELPRLLDADRYLFCDDNGVLIQMWNGIQKTWGTPIQGDQIQWQCHHVVVPTLKWLLHHAWDDRTHRPNDWAHGVPLNGRPEPAR